MDIQIKQLYNGSKLPEYTREGDGAMDLFACIDVSTTILPGRWQVIPVGVAVAVPDGYGLFILPRSGLVVKHGIDVANAPGLVDSNYRGEIKVVLFNRSHESFTVFPDARIAQACVVQLPKVNWIDVDKLPDTARGANGFGSSGV